jgi:thiamine transport system ATP-binding protein
VSLTVPDRSVLGLLGPSGCGKSTLLRAVAGLEPIRSGRVSADGSDLARVPVHRRGFGLMFQSGVLFPHLDVGGNIAYGLRRPLSRRSATVDRRVAELLELVGLPGFQPRCPVARPSGSRWPGRWRRPRGCCCSTNRWLHWTPSCASGCWRYSARC